MSQDGEPKRDLDEWIYGDNLALVRVGESVDEGLFIELESNDGGNRFRARVCFSDEKWFRRFIRDLAKKLPT